MPTDSENSPRPRITRRRAVHACDICRLRKIRCDGGQPCHSCLATSQDCAYGAELNPKSKSDAILEGIHRMENAIEGMRTLIQNKSQPSPSNNSSNGGFVASPQTCRTASLVGEHRSPSTSEQNIQNAVLSSYHTSTTESVLNWPHFDIFPSLRQNHISIFDLEQARTPISEKPTALLPYLSSDDLGYIIHSFQHNINFWYPTMSRNNIHDLRSIMARGDLSNSSTSCLAFLMLALGCASQSVEKMYSADDSDQSGVEFQRSRSTMAEMYFDGVLKRLHVAHLEMSSVATQCLFFVALYFAFLQRPLQAWQYINATAAKCRLLLSYPPPGETSEDKECLRRIFWSCYILESDYLAELSALPQSGISEIESSVGLPGHYTTHDDIRVEEQSSLYFLACISIRRLLNRVHNLLYAKETGASLQDARFPYIISELDHQLEEWRDLLPPTLQFSVDTQPMAGQHAGFLRQRYLTCRSVIYRPYLTWLLTNSNTVPVSSNVLEKCHICLDACLSHIMNLRGFAHTIMVDTWICSLSMTGAMLILLAACRFPGLQQSMGAEITTISSHLRRLIERWMQVPGLGPAQSPSVAQSLRMINEIDGFIQMEYNRNV